MISESEWYELKIKELDGRIVELHNRTNELNKELHERIVVLHHRLNELEVKLAIHDSYTDYCPHTTP